MPADTPRGRSPYGEKYAADAPVGSSSHSNCTSIGHQCQAAGDSDRRRPVTAERGAGRNLAANHEDVGQRLVEIAHRPPYFAMQSIHVAK